MPLIANDEGGSFQIAPAGTHPAYCCRIVDLGHQDEEFNGVPKILHKVLLSFELPTRKAVFDEAKGEEPFVVTKEYTLSLNEKAHLRHDLEAWRGQPFSKEELKGFDLEKVLGAPCLIAIAHKQTSSNKTVANVTTITGLPEEMLNAFPKMTTEPIFYSCDHGIGGGFTKLPEWVRKKILKSREHNDAPDQSQANAADAAANAGKGTAGAPAKKMPF